MSSRHFLFGLVILLSGLACGNTSAQNIVATTPAVQSLTLSEAEKIAVQNHPEIQAAQDVAEAASQQTRQVRSAYYPTAFGSVTGAEAENNRLRQRATMDFLHHRGRGGDHFLIKCQATSKM